MISSPPFFLLYNTPRSLDPWRLPTRWLPSGVHIHFTASSRLRLLLLNSIATSRFLSTNSAFLSHLRSQRPERTLTTTPSPDVERQLISITTAQFKFCYAWVSGGLALRWSIVVSFSGHIHTNPGGPLVGEAFRTWLLSGWKIGLPAADTGVAEFVDWDRGNQR